MQEQPSTWDEVRRIADEVELKIHLASMDARDQWNALQPRIVELEKSIASMGKRASDALDRELSSLRGALQRLREDVAKRTP